MLASTFNVFVASDIKKGDKVSYKNKNGTFYAGDYIGKCAQVGVPHKDEETAEAKNQISNTSTEAKLAYYYTYVDKDKITSNEIPKGYGFTSENSTWAQITNYAIQYAY